MKLVKTASGKTKIKMSKKEWQSLGKKAGWMDNDDSLKLAEMFDKLRNAIDILLKEDFDDPFDMGDKGDPRAKLPRIIKKFKEAIQKMGLQREFEKENGEATLEEMTKGFGQPFALSFYLSNPDIPGDNGYFCYMDREGKGGPDKPIFGPKRDALSFRSEVDAEEFASRKRLSRVEVVR